MLPLIRSLHRDATRYSGRRVRLAFATLAAAFGLLQIGTTSPVLAASGGLDDRTLQQAAHRMNAALPIMVDNDTRLERVSAGDRRLHYQFTIVNYSASELDLDFFQQGMSSQLQSDACRSPDMQPFLEQGVTLVYEYRGNDGGHLAEIAVPPATCGY